MSKPISEAVKAALSESRLGINTPYGAAKKYGVSQSVLSYHLNKKEPESCAACGAKMKKENAK